MSEQLHQKQPNRSPTYYEEIIRSLEVWNEMPVTVLDQQLAHQREFLEEMAQYIAERKENGQFDRCADASQFLQRFNKVS